MTNPIRSGDKLFVQVGFLATVRTVMGDRVDYTLDGTGDYADKRPDSTGSVPVRTLKAFGPNVWRKHHAGILGSAKVQVNHSDYASKPPVVLEGVSVDQLVHKAIARMGIAKIGNLKKFRSLRDKMAAAHEQGRRELDHLFHNDDPSSWFVVTPYKAVKAQNATASVVHI